MRAWLRLLIRRELWVCLALGAGACAPPPSPLERRCQQGVVMTDRPRAFAC